MDYRNSLPPGYRLEHYRIESVLGRGGFGITYAARELTAGVKVAIKELLPDTIATRVGHDMVAPHSNSHSDDWRWARERFLEEAHLLSSLRHRAIVRIHELINANGTNYMVMEHIEGESYETRLKKIGWESSQDSLWKIVGPIMDGLAVVHSSGFLHKDIKPDNILISKDGHPVLIDFGSARQALSQTVTMTSIVTHGYSPIEQYQSRGKTGAWTDIYALGAVMYRAITGEKVPSAPDRLIGDNFEWLRFRNPGGYSQQFLGAVDWSIQLNPEDRPQLLGQLRPYFEGDAQVVDLSTRITPDSNEETVEGNKTGLPDVKQSEPHRKNNTTTLAALVGIAAYFIASQFSHFSA